MNDGGKAKYFVEILKQQQGIHEDIVFPSPRDQVMLSDMVLTSFLRRIKAPSDTAGRIAAAHGFRSSFRDWCSEMGYSRDLAEKALAHTVSNRVEAAYHRTYLLEQRRPMMKAWAMRSLTWSFPMSKRVRPPACIGSAQCAILPNACRP